MLPLLIIIPPLPSIHYLSSVLFVHSLTHHDNLPFPSVRSTILGSLIRTLLIILLLSILSTPSQPPNDTGWSIPHRNKVTGQKTPFLMCCYNACSGMTLDTPPPHNTTRRATYATQMTRNTPPPPSRENIIRSKKEDRDTERDDDDDEDLSDGSAGW